MYVHTIRVTANGVQSTRELHPVDARLLKAMVSVGSVALAAMAAALLVTASLGAANVPGNLVLTALGVGTLLVSFRFRAAAAEMAKPAKVVVKPTAPVAPAAKPFEQTPRCKCGAKVINGNCVNRNCRHGR